MNMSQSSNQNGRKELSLGGDSLRDMKTKFLGNPALIGHALGEEFWDEKECADPYLHNTMGGPKCKNFDSRCVECSICRGGEGD